MLQVIVALLFVHAPGVKVRSPATLVAGDTDELVQPEQSVPVPAQVPVEVVAVQTIFGLMSTPDSENMTGFCNGGAAKLFKLFATVWPCVLNQGTGAEAPQPFARPCMRQIASAPVADSHA